MTQTPPATRPRIRNLEAWGAGFFRVNDDGKLSVCPSGEPDSAICLQTLCEDIQAKGLSCPTLIRFNQILHRRIEQLYEAFAQAISGHDYKGQYQAAYPIKVNQQRKVVAEILKHPTHRVGLEAGSKPELLAIIGLSQTPDALIICNGYKDREYIRLALIAQKLGHRVILIVEKAGELPLILESAKAMGITPTLGLRLKLNNTGKGHWQNSGGEKSKFGLTARDVLHCVETLKNANLLSALQVLHIHLGSQIANLRDIQRGVSEAARFYTELHALGAPIDTLDVGGGLGVDYEGTASRQTFSMNYSWQQYASNIVRLLKEHCDEAHLPHPNIITESGRALTAHHAMLVTNIIDIQNKTATIPSAPTAQEPHILHDVWQLYDKLTPGNALETYHELQHWFSEGKQLFNHRLLSLDERAHLEDLYIACQHKLATLLDPSIRTHREVLEMLREKLASQVFCNFSLFQSMPDVWAISQIFPILPLTHLHQEASVQGILQDLTCDSDGQIETYVDGDNLEKTLPLPIHGKPPLLGVFMLGAYQEILGDMHNLFGDTHSIHVDSDSTGNYQLSTAIPGDTVSDVLRFVHFDIDKLRDAYTSQIDACATLTREEKTNFQETLLEGLNAYTYFVEG